MNTLGLLLTYRQHGIVPESRHVRMPINQPLHGIEVKICKMAAGEHQISSTSSSESNATLVKDTKSFLEPIRNGNYGTPVAMPLESRTKRKIDQDGNVFLSTLFGPGVQAKKPKLNGIIEDDERMDNAEEHLKPATDSAGISLSDVTRLRETDTQVQSASAHDIYAPHKASIEQLSNHAAMRESYQLKAQVMSEQLRQSQIEFQETEEKIAQLRAKALDLEKEIKKHTKILRNYAYLSGSFRAAEYDLAQQLVTVLSDRISHLNDGPASLTSESN